MLATSALRYRYPTGDFELRLPPLQVAAGRTLALVGPSGCGKSTLLALLAGSLQPLEGSIHVQDRRIDDRSDAERRAYRIATVGLIFQEFRLIESLDVLDNILLPYRLHPALPLDAAAHARALELAQQLGIDRHLRRYPAQLSHGERQRVAVARGLLARPKVLLADEPTGNLDPLGKRRLLDALLALARYDGACVIVATHDYGLLDSFDAVHDFEGERR